MTDTQTVQARLHTLMQAGLVERLPNGWITLTDKGKAISAAELEAIASAR